MLAFSLLAVSSLLFSSGEAAYLDRIDALRTEQDTFLDRESDPGTVSVAATGFGVLALAHGVDRGLRDREEVLQIAENAFDHTVKANDPRNRGWLPHFTDLHGNAKPYSEISTIDTAIFYAGMLRAAELLKGADLTKRVRESLSRVDVQFVVRDGVFLHGFYWHWPSGLTATSAVPSEGPRFIPYTWNDSSEGLILYHLFDMPFPLQVRRLDYPLFVYMYPLCFFDDPGYDRLLQEAIDYQVQNYGYWGVTSTDGPNGYVVWDERIVSPVLIAAVADRYPHYADEVQKLNVRPSAVAMHLDSDWVAEDDLTIDLASAYVLYARTAASRSGGGPVLITVPATAPAGGAR